MVVPLGGLGDLGRFILFPLSRIPGPFGFSLPVALKGISSSLSLELELSLAAGPSLLAKVLLVYEPADELGAGDFLVHKHIRPFAGPLEEVAGLRGRTTADQCDVTTFAKTRTILPGKETRKLDRLAMKANGDIG